MQVELDQDHAFEHQAAFELDDLVVRPGPLLDRGELLDSLDEETAVPAPVEQAQAAEAGNLGPETPEEVVPLLTSRRLRIRVDAEVPGVELLDDASDRTAFAAGIGSLHHDEETRTDTAVADLPAEREPQLQESRLRSRQSFVVLVTAELCRQVEIIKSSHALPTLRAVGRSRNESLVGTPCPVPWPTMFVKICGITNEDDALLSVAMGADAVGFNFVSGSKRQISPQIAYDISRRLPPEILTVGIFRNEHPSSGRRTRTSGRRQVRAAARA